MHHVDTVFEIREQKNKKRRASIHNGNLDIDSHIKAYDLCLDLISVCLQKKKNVLNYFAVLKMEESQ